MFNTSLKNQLVSAFDDSYLSTLKNVYIRYATKTTLELVDYLYSYFDRISATYMSANDKRLRFLFKWILCIVEEAEPLEGLIDILN